MKDKQLKDPIYGYISIPADIMGGIVDAAPFQRLRRITQTSYAPLYSSAVHNRFVHSLGVYHLGSLAASALQNEIRQLIENRSISFELNPDELECTVRVFQLACLLHDVGHAPFSHTGEQFYLEDAKEYEQLHALLISEVNERQFEEDVPKEQSTFAAPHEIMSAIVGIREFSEFLKTDVERSFFARCITGYQYTDNKGIQSIRNCFVQLLNSKVIDVDKLDYLIRDAYITGFYTVRIDYVRLLSALTVIPRGDGYELAYHKSAISVIENVVYAHDAERKWIQTHPVILYESYLLQHIMSMLSEKYDGSDHKLFSVESLSVNGHTLQDGTHIRLLCDDDIIFLMKKYLDDSAFVREYFERSARRHALWKSEAEYSAFAFEVASAGAVVDSIKSALKATAQYLSMDSSNWVIDEALASRLGSDLKNLAGLGLDPNTLAAQQKEKDAIYKVVTYLLEYAKKAGYVGDFVLLKSSQFSSGFQKPDFSSIKIVFKTGDGIKPVHFGEQVASYAGVSKNRDDYFYLFYDRSQEGASNLEKNTLFEGLFKEFVGYK